MKINESIEDDIKKKLGLVEGKERIKLLERRASLLHSHLKDAVWRLDILDSTKSHTDPKPFLLLEKVFSFQPTRL